MIHWANKGSTVRHAVALVTAACLIFVSLAAFYARGAPPSGRVEVNAATNTESFFHFIVPATSSNRNLCRLLLSAIALDFPAPILINWGAPENEDPYVLHVAKVVKILEYLDSLDASHDKALALIVDGYDLFLQLPPSVLISRYHEAISSLNGQPTSLESLGELSPEAPYTSVLFGPDKICWPEDPSRPACWAIPQSPLAEGAFGPETDSGRWRFHYRPRWLNSGTIMGPVRDLRHLFRATHERIESMNGKGVVSDQYYLAELFGEQEFIRRRNNAIPAPTAQDMFISTGYNGEGSMDAVYFKEPIIRRDQRTEWHIGIDYMSAMFQTTAWYKESLDWVYYLSEELPRDLVGTAPPLSHLDLGVCEDPTAASCTGTSTTAAASTLTWSDVKLGSNFATGTIFGLVHFTPPKDLIARWWPRMWYFAFAKDIIAAHLRRNSQLRASDTPAAPPSDEFSSVWTTAAAGQVWRAYTPPSAAGHLRDAPLAYTTAGGAFDWLQLCAAHESAVLDNEMEDDEIPESMRPPPANPEPVDPEPATPQPPPAAAAPIGGDAVDIVGADQPHRSIFGGGVGKWFKGLFGGGA